jgi:hypothetical protein
MAAQIQEYQETLGMVFRISGILGKYQMSLTSQLNKKIEKSEDDIQVSIMLNDKELNVTLAYGPY